MSEEASLDRAAVEAALAALSAADPAAIHSRQLALARLVADQGPEGAAQQLALVERFLEGEPLEAELREARQECWTHVGSLACGCSIADSASAHALLVCFETPPAAHTPPALAEQVERVLRCGVSLARVLRVLTSACLLLALLAGRAQAAPQRDPPLLFGGPVKKSKVEVQVDPRLPRGSLVPATRARPDSAQALCSFSRPVCVHALPDVADAQAQLPVALAAFERAYERTVLALRLPAPLADRGAGGSDALDWYVGATGAPLSVEQEALTPGQMDAAPVFCRGTLAGEALLERQASLCVGEALASSLDAGEGPDARRALALELWWITGAKTSLDVQAVDDAQAHPERALATDGEVGLAAAGRFALLLEMLETTRSAASPGVLAASLFSAAGSRTPAGAARYANEPDVFDVLRHSVDEDTTRYADLLVDFALRRSLAGDRDDGTRFPALAFAGAFARPQFDWVIPFSSLPRRLLSGRPIAQSGAELIWLEMDEAPIGVTIGFRAEWEAPVAFQWRILVLDAEGRELRRMNITFQERATSAEGRVLRVDGAKAMIIAGVNLGGVDLTHPFDPDITPFEPSACTVYLAAM